MEPFAKDGVWWTGKKRGFDEEGAGGNDNASACSGDKRDLSGFLGKGRMSRFGYIGEVVESNISPAEAGGEYGAPANIQEKASVSFVHT